MTIPGYRDPLLNGNDLLQEGWPPGPQIGQMLEAVREMQARGIQDRDYVLKLLRRDFPAPSPKLWMHKEPRPLSEAIESTCDEDARNIGNVRRLMNELLCSPVIERGAIMPDACPAGVATATIPVGGAIAVRNAIVPSAHSADICCSMYASFYRSELPVGEQMDALMASTRFGAGGRPHEDWVHDPVLEEDVWENPFLTGLQRHAAMHMADQGDGNHFAWIGRVRLSAEQVDQLERAGHVEHSTALRGVAGGSDRSSAGSGGADVEYTVLVTHHGSRGLGAHVYKRGQKAAEDHTRRVAEGVPQAAAWLDYAEDSGRAYWEALQYVSRWTLANHRSIHRGFLERIAVKPVTQLGNEHNFVWKRGDTFLHGKGATPAWKDEEGRPLLGLIPLNMAAPVLLVLGRDNPQFLSFAPHGAGRNVSRSALVKPFRDASGRLDEKTVSRVVNQHTAGLDIRWFAGKPDLSESPIGYKSATQVAAQIRQFGLADIVAEISPLGCIMAGDAGPRPWERLKEELTPKQKRQIEHRADRRILKQHLRHGGDGDDEED